MPFHDIADEGRLTVAVGTREVELTAAIHGTIAVVVRFALEHPSIRHTAPSGLLHVWGRPIPL